MFRCDHCDETFHNEWTEDEAREEYAAHFPGDIGEETVSLCDDCYCRAVAWAKSEGLIAGGEA